MDIIKVFIFKIFLTILSTQGLRWDNSKIPNANISTIFLGSTRIGPVIDVYYGNQVVIVKNIEPYNFAITIYCLVTGYRNDSKLSYKFCSKGYCENASPFMHSTKTHYKISGDIISEKMNGKKIKGLLLKITLISNEDSSNDFHCEVTDDKYLLDLRSSQIQIRDVHYWKQNLVMNRNNSKSLLPVINKKNLPFTFPCLEDSLIFNSNRPKWVPLEILHPVKWSICPVKSNFGSLKVLDKMSFSTCSEFSLLKWPTERDQTLKPRKIKEMVNWKYSRDASGNLTIFKFDNSDLTYAFMCYIKKEGVIYPINTYISRYDNDEIIEGVKFDSTKTVEENRLSPISPTVQSVRISARSVPFSSDNLSPIVIPVKYYSSSRANWKWFHNNKELSNSISILPDKYSLTFAREITFEMQGGYSLIVNDGGDQLNFTVNVEVVRSPGLVDTDCVPRIHYVWEGEHVNFRCQYRFHPTILEFKINQQKIQSNQFNSLNKKHYPYLYNLNYTISPLPGEVFSSETLIYKAISLNKSQDHTITIDMGNDYGMNVISSSIYVLPSIGSRIERFPEEFECPGYCSSQNYHDLYCRFRTDDFLDKELQIHHYWILNERKLDFSQNTSNILKTYLTIDPKTKDLKLHPINSSDIQHNEKVKTLLKNTLLECRIQLVSNLDGKVVYDSRLDKNVKRKLKSKFTLDDMSTYIYLGISIGFLVLLFGIITLVFVYRKYQNRGKTYKMIYIDNQLGIDPEKELKELCIQDYQPWTEHADKMFSSCTDINDENDYEEEDMKTL